jgi:kelch-like protein 10
MIKSMSTSRSGIGIVAFNDHIYAVGGFDGTSRLKSAEKYNINNEMWTRVSSMQIPRSNFGIAVFDDQIFAIGGYNGEGTCSDVECLNKDDEVWHFKSHLNLNRSALVACTLKGIENIKPFSIIKTQIKIISNKQN